MTIFCPKYDEFTKEEDAEKYIIYNVSQLASLLEMSDVGCNLF